MKPYKTLIINLVLSFFIMYLVMFLNIADIKHFYFSVSRTYMTLLMVFPMAILMILTMRHMYTDKRKNTNIVVASILGFILALFGLRNQIFVNDAQYMKAMIPHHSSAIMVSESNTFDDSELIQLAKDIIKAQKEEIELMKKLLNN